MKPSAERVELERRDADRRINVSIGGQPFTSYLWDPELAKPVLFPLRTAGGQEITRGYPLQERPGESQDHPHHIGLWFNYGDVDGIDYWGNSAGVRQAQPDSDEGSVVHETIRGLRGGEGRGEFTSLSAWVRPDGKPALREETRYVFQAAPGRRLVDRIATLSARGKPVRFVDNKEGLLGLRLGKALEHASKKNPEGTGIYRSSEGKEGDQVWGTRARWVMVRGRLPGPPATTVAVTVAIFDHPRNFGHPTYWHARGYGLFAANPLGARAFTKGAETSGFVLTPGKPARFAYRLLIADAALTPEELEAEYQRFAGGK